MSTDAILDALNPEQRRAVEAVRGPVCILAGAGSGKTTTITRRIANQVGSGPHFIAFRHFQQPPSRRSADDAHGAIINPVARKIRKILRSGLEIGAPSPQFNNGSAPDIPVAATTDSANTGE